MATTIKFKRGGTFSYGCLVTLPTGTWTARAQLRRAAGNLVAELTATLTPPVAPATAHTLLLVCPASSTADWPLEVLKGDVMFTSSATVPVVLPTSTLSVQVIEQVTK